MRRSVIRRLGKRTEVPNRSAASAMVSNLSMVSSHNRSIYVSQRLPRKRHCSSVHIGGPSFEGDSGRRAVTSRHGLKPTEDREAHTRNSLRNQDKQG